MNNKNFIVPKNIQDSCLILNRYYLPARYPDVPEIPRMANKETANAAIKIAKKIVKFVEDKLS